MDEKEELRAVPAPLHPIEVRIHIGANGKEELRRIAGEIIAMIDEGHTQGFGGGWDGCYSLTTTERNISADEYRNELEAWSEGTRVIQ